MQHEGVPVSGQTLDEPSRGVVGGQGIGLFQKLRTLIGGVSMPPDEEIDHRKELPQRLSSDQDEVNSGQRPLGSKALVSLVTG